MRIIKEAREYLKRAGFKDPQAKDIKYKISHSHTDRASWLGPIDLHKYRINPKKTPQIIEFIIVEASGDIYLFAYEKNTWDPTDIPERLKKIRRDITKLIGPREASIEQFKDLEEVEAHDRE